jgi:hypothetical protein
LEKTHSALIISVFGTLLTAFPKLITTFSRTFVSAYARKMLKEYPYTAPPHTNPWILPVLPTLLAKLAGQSGREIQPLREKTGPPLINLTF